MKSLLKIENLRKIYHTKKEEILAIEDFSFTIQDGEFIAIVGPSGCGKSTLLNILGNLDQKSEGNIEFKENTSIGYMLQDRKSVV